MSDLSRGWKIARRRILPGALALLLVFGAYLLWGSEPGRAPVRYEAVALLELKLQGLPLASYLELEDLLHSPSFLEKLRQELACRKEEKVELQLAPLAGGVAELKASSEGSRERARTALQKTCELVQARRLLLAPKLSPSSLKELREKIAGAESRERYLRERLRYLDSSAAPQQKVGRFREQLSREESRLSELRQQASLLSTGEPLPLELGFLRAPEPLLERVSLRDLFRKEKGRLLWLSAAVALSILGAFLLDIVSFKVNHPREVAQLLSLPVLATLRIPHLKVLYREKKRTI